MICEALFSIGCAGIGRKDKGNTAKFGKSEFREKLSSDEGSFSQEYFVYCKKK